MTATLPAFARDLLDRPVHATVASLESDGSPQLSLIWFKRDGDDVVFSTLGGRRKAQNWTHDDRAALLAFDPDDAGRYVEVRGRVTLVEDPDGSLIHELSQRYEGRDFTGIVEDRVIVRLSPERVVVR